MTQDLSNYTADYYRRAWRQLEYPHILRADQLAALCYALNWPYWGREVKNDDDRDPGRILSIGCGRGELESQLETLGFAVTGVDPSAGAKEMYRGSTFSPIWTPEMVRSANTVIFCESIEHIPLEQTLELFTHLCTGTRVIVVNYIDFHPIIPSPDDDGWDHITQIDDALYNQLSAGKTVLLRRASHLVLEV